MKIDKKLKKYTFFAVFFAFLMIFSLIIGNYNNFYCLMQNEQQVVNIENKIQNIYINNFEQVKNRTAGSLGEKHMSNVLVEYLQSQNIAAYGENYVQNFDWGKNSSSQNILGFIDNNSENYVILGAHYDSIYVAGKSYGYSDNISGVVAVLELAEQLKSIDLDFNIILGFWGAEEVGCEGSEYFVKNLDENVKKHTLLYINFDSVGAGTNLYYYHSDFNTKYGDFLDKFFENDIKNAEGKYMTSIFGNANYGSIGLNSDNSSFLKNGINSLFFFAGELDNQLGKGYTEKQGIDKIMHNTDSIETVEAVFGDDFVNKISQVVSATQTLLTDSNFNNQTFSAGQINPAVYSDWVLKFSGVGLVLVLFIGYLIWINTSKKFKQKK